MKQNATRWKKGQSGNPHGRMKGAGRITMLRESLAEQLPDIINMVAKAAKEGDMQAAKLILERTIPPLKPQELSVEMPVVTGDLTTDIEQILEAAMNGEMMPTYASQLIETLTTGIVKRDDTAEHMERQEDMKPMKELLARGRSYTYKNTV